MTFKTTVQCQCKYLIKEKKYLVCRLTKKISGEISAGGSKLLA